MKTKAFIFVLLIAAVGFAQDKGSVILFAGYGQSFFSSEINDGFDSVDEAKYILVGNRNRIKVNRELDIEGAEAGKADNAAIHAGFKFGF